MIVTLASAGPFTQSESVMGGKADSAVAPGVGFWVTTVQPELSRMDDCSGNVTTLVGVSWAIVVAVEVGVVCDLGRQPASPRARIVMINKNVLRMHRSMNKYCAILPVKG